MPASSSSPPRQSRSKTGKVLSAAEHKQRIDAANSANRKRGMSRDEQNAWARHNARKGPTRPASGASGPTSYTAGVGNQNHPAYVSTSRARSAFEAHGVSGADINQSKDPKSGFLNFSGKDPVVHQKFVDALKSAGFRVAQAKDGSGYAVNAAGQGVRLGKPGSRVAPSPAPQDIKFNPDTGRFQSSNRVRRVSTRGMMFKS